MLFFAKKVLSRIFFPVPLSLEFLLVGLILLWFTRRQRAGKTLVTCGAMLLLGFSNFLTSNALLRPLEHRYPSLVAAPPAAGKDAVGFIVVLGSFGNHDPELPASSHISPDLMARLIEGLRLHREISGSRLILSGSRDSAEGMAKMAEALGVSAQDIQELAEPRDTEEESQQIAPIVGPHRFILVTSAAHMPRAMGFFRKRGLQPIAAPTDYLAPHHSIEIDSFVPDGYNIFEAQIAVYEYLGLAWETLRGKI